MGKDDNVALTQIKAEMPRLAMRGLTGLPLPTVGTSVKLERILSTSGRADKWSMTT